MVPSLFNLSFYRFFRVGDAAALAELRSRLQTLCSEHGIQGTILIAHEGINGMISGSREAIDLFKNFARETLGIEEKVFKETGIPGHSFTRLLVKIKKEIISVGDPDLRPDERTAERIQPRELKRWLDEGRPMVLLDTRNDYEVEVGTFQGAKQLGLETSREFTAKASEHLSEWKDLPVVTFCTGGIRCEKASAALLKLGHKDVYQLDGGILRYFLENGGAHFDGKCFVFDWRMAVDGELRPVERSEDPEREFGRHRRKKQDQPE